MKFALYLLALAMVVAAMLWSCAKQQHAAAVRDEDEAAIDAAIEAGVREIESNTRIEPSKP